MTPATDTGLAAVWGAMIGQRGAVEVLARAAQVAAETVSGVSGLDLGLAPQSAPSAAAMTHAWLFVGPAGSGRSVAARAFAAALECEHGPGPEAGCGECHECHTALKGSHADIALVRTEQLSIGVKEVRDLVRRAALSPAGRRWQIFIVEDADRLTEQAANALLKAIEEPTVRTVWMLCAPTVEDV
ncbi:MAG: polymerase subunit delta, partial [Jatrophihabitantaceae bacterium]|nr:polymerase subunit delta [Jatrophihabitantaceae bacterium]